MSPTEEQCDFVEAHGDDGYLRCGLEREHSGAHQNAYGQEMKRAFRREQTDHETFCREADERATKAEAQLLAAQAREGELRRALSGAVTVLDNARKVFGGSGMGGPGALEDDCEFAARKGRAALDMPIDATALREFALRVAREGMRTGWDSGEEVPNEVVDVVMKGLDLE